MNVNQYFRVPKSTIPLTTGRNIDTDGLLGFFSFCKMNGYTGPCINIRRSSDGTNINIGFVDDYLDEAAISSFCAGTTGRIRVWFNQKDTPTFNFIQASTLGPIIFQSGAIVKQNLKVAALMGTQDHMAIDPINSIVCKSVFAVSKINTYSIVNYITWSGVGQSGLAQGGTGGGVNGLTAITGNAIRMANNFENTNRSLSTFINDATNGQIWSNGANNAVSSGAISDMTVSDIGRRDASLSLNGNFQEFILYSTDKKPQRVSIESEINAYYSIF